MSAVERQADNEKAKPIFRELSANDLEPEITEIESLCMECGKNVHNLFTYLVILFQSEICVTFVLNDVLKYLSPGCY